MSSNPSSTAVDGDPAADVRTVVPGADAADLPQVDGPMTVPGADPQDAPVAATGPVMVDLQDEARNLAREAAVAEAGRADHVGGFVVALAEDDVAVTATFAALQAGYLGWNWSVTLAFLEHADPTVSEVVLLPADGALLAPAWVPWDERIRPGDLGVGDLLPPGPDDPRVVPAYLASDDPAVEAVARELGIGRVRVLSREGRVDFAERLHDGSFGPSDDMALSAPAHCVTCAFYLPLAGSLGQLLGACGNEFAPADGRVVDAGYGCGAHSETVVQMPARSAASDVVIDETSLEVHRRRPTSTADPSRRRPDRLEDTASGEPEIPDADAILLDEWADPYLVGLELAELELAEAALLDADPGPDDAMPDDETPDDAMPDDETPDDAMPDDETPDDAMPDDETPDDETPGDAMPDDVMPDDVMADELPTEVQQSPASDPQD